MLRNISICLVVLALCAVPALATEDPTFGQNPGPGEEAPPAQAPEVTPVTPGDGHTRYVCPRNDGIDVPDPGKCPICGDDLVVAAPAPAASPSPGDNGNHGQGNNGQGQGDDKPKDSRDRE
jgi:hypothetical protein